MDFLSEVSGPKGLHFLKLCGQDALDLKGKEILWLPTLSAKLLPEIYKLRGREQVQNCFELGAFGLPPRLFGKLLKPFM